PGDVIGNARASAAIVANAAARGAALVVFPELSLTGYELDRIAATPEAWLQEGDARLDGVRKACSEHRVVAVLGAPWRTREERKRLAALIIDQEGAVHTSFKEHLHGREGTLFEAGH